MYYNNATRERMSFDKGDINMKQHKMPILAFPYTFSLQYNTLGFKLNMMCSRGRRKHTERHEAQRISEAQ